MKRFALLSAIAVSGLSLTTVASPDHQQKSCSSTTAYSSTKAGKNIVETALAAGSFKTLSTALQTADLVDALQGEGPFTVFAPTDEAFARLPKGTVDSLLEPENRGTLTEILTYHVVPGAVRAADVVKLNNGTALNGQRFNIEANDDGVRVAGVKVVKTDIECSNGVIHVIDAVMMPATKDIVGTTVEAGSFKTLAAALKAAGLIEALQGDGPFTVFAPTDEAFAALPDGTVENLLKPENRDKLIAVLKYHVVSGRVYSDQLANGEVATLQGSTIEVKLGQGGPMIDKAGVAAADIETTNGVIHVIDRVLLP